MIRFVLAIALSPILAAPVSAQDADLLAGKRVAFLGDSNTQAGGYVSFATYTWRDCTRRRTSIS